MAQRRLRALALRMLRILGQVGVLRSLVRENRFDGWPCARQVGGLANPRG